ncbi:ABC transporter substrate-binding protein [Paracoccus sp. (in: a-proteobacteria)]|uniref:ABC transporter substrate-binding protein n=1 Tax=Paracoccus sp. TaxID=267 RepID=UPI003A8B172C
MKKRNFLKSTIFAIAAAAMPASAMARDSVKVAYMKIPPLVHMIYALENGIFEQNDLEVDLTVVNGGPELMTALASGSVDIGMTAVGIVLLARAKGLKLQAFGTGDYEEPGDIRNWIVADANDGIASLKDLEGKTVGVVAKNSPAELSVRDHMLAAGADPDTVKFVALPFPQLPSALEVGNVDAVFVGDPFHTQLQNSTKAKATDLSEGLIATLDQDGRIALGGWFARDEWLADEKNRDIARRLLKSILQSNRELDADPAKFYAILERDFGMPPDVAAKNPLHLNTGPLVAEPANYQPTIDALARTGMIKESYPASDVVVSISDE